MSKLKKWKAGLSLLMSGVLLAAAVPAMPVSGATSTMATCSIDSSKRHQTITGFGGINHPEWTADKGGDLNAEQRQVAFGTEGTQLGMTVLRIFINPDKNQWKNAVPTAQYAYEHGITVFASPWEPPSSLAEPGTGGPRGGKLHLPKSNYAAYARHLNDFGEYMKSQGVELAAISVQNEPDWSEEWTAWSSDETTDFIANYGHLITSAPLMSPETFQYGNKDYYTKILNNAKAFENCDLFGTHFYGTSRNSMDFRELENCGKPIWMTEVYVPNSNANTANIWSDAIQVSENIHNALVVGNMSAYVWWTIRRSYGPITDDSKPSKRGFALAQYSRYVRPGAVRLECTEQPSGNVLVSAYENIDGSIAIVAINKNNNAVNQDFSTGANIQGVQAYRSSDNEALKSVGAVNYNGGNFTATLNASSVTTFLVKTDKTSGGNPNGIGGNVTPAKLELDEDGYYIHDTFENGTNSWEGRGGATVAQSGDAYAGEKSLLISGRTSAWNGAQKSLGYLYKAGETFSFAVCAQSVSGDQDLMLSIQYTDANGETAYDHIANATTAVGNYVLLSNSNYTLPAGGSGFTIYVESASGTGNIRIDEVIVAPEGTSFDGPKPVTLTPGDLNKDGVINAVDLSLCKRGLISGFKDKTEEKLADVGGSGTATIADAIQIAKFISRVITEFEQEPKEQGSDTPLYTMAEYVAKFANIPVNMEPNDSHNEKAGVQYGTIKSGTYFSTTCGRNKPYNILLPAGYSEDKQYPVLYCMHGYYENQDRMIIKGNGTMYTRQIIGNLIASGEAEDMIVVFPYIFTSKTLENCTGMNDENNAAYDNFINELVNDLMPYMEQNYSIKTGKVNTAITGFSMGGRESLLIGMKRGDLFGYVGAICPAPGVSGAFKWNTEEETPYMLFITGGDNDTVVYDNPKNYHNNFTQNGVPHIWHYVAGGYHGDNSIQSHLYSFCKTLFKVTQ